MSGSTVPVYVPLELAQAAAVQAGEVWSGPAHAPTAALREAHDIEAADDEGAGYTALGYAGLAALLGTTGLRLVLAADVGPDQVSTPKDDGAFGEIEVTGLRWSQVQALFADEPGAAADLGKARTLAAGRSLAAVADDETVLDLLDRWDLLWYATQELAELV